MGRTQIRFGWAVVALSVGAAALTVGLGAQAPQGQAPQAPRTPRAAAPADLTGYWAAAITQRHGWRIAILFFGVWFVFSGLALIRFMRAPVRGITDDHLLDERKRDV